jgi:Putative peptidoglycan binding domain
MNTKSITSNRLSIGIFSAISATLLLSAGMPVQAQTNSSPLNQAPNQTDNPTQLNNPQTELNGTPSTPNQTPAQQNVTPSQPSQNVTPSSSNPLGNYSNTQAPYLSYGSRGQAVRDVQTFLSQQGFYQGSIDGIYGTQTRNAVRAYQRSRNLIADGIIGHNAQFTIGSI